LGSDTRLSFIFQASVRYPTPTLGSDTRLSFIFSSFCEVSDPNPGVRYQALIHFSSFCEVSGPNPGVGSQVLFHFSSFCEVSDPNPGVRYQALIHFSSFCEVSGPNPGVGSQVLCHFSSFCEVSTRPQPRGQIPGSHSFFQASARYPTPTPRSDTRLSFIFSNFCEVSDPNPGVRYQALIHFFKLLRGIRPQPRGQIPGSRSFFQASVKYPTPTLGSDTRLSFIFSSFCEVSDPNPGVGYQALIHFFKLLRGI
jgi:hypothetical protein